MINNTIVINKIDKRKRVTIIVFMSLLIILIASATIFSLAKYSKKENGLAYVVTMKNFEFRADFNNAAIGSVEENIVAFKDVTYDYNYDEENLEKAFIDSSEFIRINEGDEINITETDHLFNYYDSEYDERMFKFTYYNWIMKEGENGEPPYPSISADQIAPYCIIKFFNIDNEPIKTVDLETLQTLEYTGQRSFTKEIYFDTFIGEMKDEGIFSDCKYAVIMLRTYRPLRKTLGLRVNFPDVLPAPPQASVNITDGVATLTLIPNNAALSDISISWDDERLAANNTLENMRDFADRQSVDLEDAVPEQSAPRLSASPDGKAAPAEPVPEVQTYEFYILDDAVTAFAGFPDGELVTLEPDEDGRYAISLEPAN